VRPDDTLTFTEGHASFRWRLSALLTGIITLLPIIASTSPTAEQARQALLASQAVVKVESPDKALSVEQGIQSHGIFVYPPGPHASGSATFSLSSGESSEGWMPSLSWSRPSASRARS